MIYPVFKPCEWQADRLVLFESRPDSASPGWRQEMIDTNDS